ncbi:MAG TPA: hypothetical protein VGQ49_16775 [Bryobacteraceae bacterium]|jgi:hypothetical protein|nr:hypothetical protein [Bryobacteraceae bacterium]
MPKKKRPDSGRDSHGRFLPGVSGNRLGAATKLSDPDGSVGEIVAELASKKKIATALLRRATAGDPRALEIVLQMLQRAGKDNVPKDGVNYDLLTTVQIEVVRFLTRRAHGENSPDTELLELLQAATAELEPAPENDAEEPEQEETSHAPEEGVTDEEVAAFLKGDKAILIPAARGKDPNDPDLLVNQQRLEKEQQQREWDKLYGPDNSDLPILRKPQGSGGYLT